MNQFFTRFLEMFTMIGYSKAAKELTRMGYHKDAQTLIAELHKLESKRNQTKLS